MKRHTLVDGHFGPFRLLGGTDDHANDRHLISYNVLFMFNSNDGPISLDF